MNMNFGNEPPKSGHRSLNLSNSEPVGDKHREELESHKVQPTNIGNISINPSDVLCGRGKVSFNHVGNRRFRDLVSASVTKYNEAASRMEKAKIVNGIVDEIRSSGGRFLRQDEKEGTWHALNNAQCREKVGHAVRDATASLEARKKRKLMQEAAQKNVVSTILAKTDAACFNMDIPLSDFHASSNYDHDSIAMRYTKSQPFSSGSDDDKLFVGCAGDFFDTPTDFRQGLQQQSLISSLRPHRAQRDELVDSMGGANVWTPSDYFNVPPKQLAASEDSDDQFLAYIDEVLGPLDPAPV